MCIPDLPVSNFRGDRMTGLCHWAQLTVVTFRKILNMNLWNVLFYFIQDNITKYLRKFCLKKNIQKGKGGTYLRKEKNYGKKINHQDWHLQFNSFLNNQQAFFKSWLYTYFLRHMFPNRKISWVSKDFAKFVSYSNCNN